MMKSNDPILINKSTTYIASNKKINLVQDILEDACDPSMTNDLRWKGMSVYQIKMIAMRDLTNLPAPVKITYIPDSAVYKFYLNAAKQRGWVTK